MVCNSCHSHNTNGPLSCTHCGRPLTTVTISVPAPDELPVDTELQGGIYTLRGVLGRGGFAISYLAYDANLDCFVAIKEFFPEGCKRQGLHVQLSQVPPHFNVGQAKFREEARTLKKFHQNSTQNPNIVQVFTFFETNDTAYMVMELLEGQTLAQIVEDQGAFSEKQAIGIISKVGNALQAVHNADVLHLDVNPANVMVCDGQRVVLMDFGLAKGSQLARSYATRPLDISPCFGREGYAPLEQYDRSATLTATADLYALSALLCFLLTGYEPQAANERNIYDRLTPPQNATKNVRDVVMGALAVAEDQRQPRTVSEFVHNLAVSPQPTPQPAPQVAPVAPQSGNPPVFPKQMAPAPAKPFPWATLWLATLTGILMGAAALSTLGGKSLAFTPPWVSPTPTPTIIPTPTATPTPTPLAFDARGTWQGSLRGEPISLVVPEQDGDSFIGYLVALTGGGVVKVEVKGEIDSNSDASKVTLREAEIMAQSKPSLWVLGNNTGSYSADKRRMKGTGQATASDGTAHNYTWSLHKTGSQRDAPQLNIAATSKINLLGTWQGWRHAQKATLFIEKQTGDVFEGTLSESATLSKTAIWGYFVPGTKEIVLMEGETSPSDNAESSDGWLRQGTGFVSRQGKRLSGTGRDQDTSAFRWAFRLQSRSTAPIPTPTVTQAPIETSTPTPTEFFSPLPVPEASVFDPVGYWQGDVGGSPTFLVVTRRVGNKFDGIFHLKSGGNLIQVLVQGRLSPPNRIVLQEIKTFPSSTSWVCGRDIGMFSSDGSTMFGEGTDKTHSYSWQFAKQSGTPLNLPTDEALDVERYPTTRWRPWDSVEVDTLSLEQVNWAINEIYARHGHWFPNPTTYAQFRRTAWYRPVLGKTAEMAQSEFNEFENENVKALANARHALKLAAKPTGY